MRQIGTLPGTLDPKIFGDYLLSLGISSRAVESKDGWAVWIHDEDRLARARQELEAYITNPADARFAEATTAARAVRQREAKLDKQYRKNFRDLSGSWDSVNFRRRPLTISLVVVCVGVFLACSYSPQWYFLLWDHLAFFSIGRLIAGIDPQTGLDEIVRQGQVWRLITPAFLHVTIPHLIFNMWATIVEGTIIETRRGTKVLAVLVFLSAIASNVGQYIFALQVDHAVHPWGGISGVGYALFGYLWMKGRYEPEQGMILHPRSVQIMLLWLAFGFTGMMPMANGAHLVGLIVGVLFGLARF